MSERVVLASTALLCLLNGELGSERVSEALPSAVVGAVNLAEVVAKLHEKGLTAEEADEVLGRLNLDVRPLTAVQAHAAGHLRSATRALGLWLGVTAPASRSRLSLARRHSLQIANGAGPEVGVAVKVIR